MASTPPTDAIIAGLLQAANTPKPPKQPTAGQSETYELAVKLKQLLENHHRDRAAAVTNVCEVIQAVQLLPQGPGRKALRRTFVDVISRGIEWNRVDMVKSTAANIVKKELSSAFGDPIRGLDDRQVDWVGLISHVVAAHKRQEAGTLREGIQGALIREYDPGNLEEAFAAYQQKQGGGEEPDASAS